MKKHLLTTTFLIASVFTSFAQITNGGFENWVQDGANCMSPSNWGTINGSTSVTGNCTVNQETSSVHGGASAVEMSTVHIFFPPFVDQLAPGILTNGTVNTQTQAVEGGQAFTQRPTAFTGWYTAAPVNNDIYSFSALLINEATGDTVGTADWSGNATVNTYTMFSAPVVYTLPDVPSLLQIVMLPSDPGNPQEGSVFTVDDLDYETVTVGISETEKAMIKTYPNPVVDEVFFDIANQDVVNVSIYNILGVKEMQQSLTASSNRVDMSQFANGTYVWQMTSLNGELIKTGKLVVTK